MTKALTHVPYDEFSSNLGDFFDRVIHDSETIVVEKEAGEIAVLKPVRVRRPRHRKKTEEDRAAFLSSFGGWSDVDVDAFLKNIYDSRHRPSRPPVEL